MKSILLTVFLFIFSFAYCQTTIQRDAEIEKMVQSANEISAYYQARGFSQVLFSFVPNKSAVTQEPLGIYNHLIERMQQSEMRKFEIVDAFSMLSKKGKDGYWFNDTHWNCTGSNAWLDSVNARLQIVSAN